MANVIVEGKKGVLHNGRIYTGYEENVSDAAVEAIKKAGRKVKKVNSAPGADELPKTGFAGRNEEPPSSEAYELTTLEAATAEIARSLAAEGFTTIESVADASVADLKAADGVGDATAKNLKAQAIERAENDQQSEGGGSGAPDSID